MDADVSWMAFRNAINGGEHRKARRQGCDRDSERGQRVVAELETAGAKEFAEFRRARPPLSDGSDIGWRGG